MNMNSDSSPSLLGIVAGKALHLQSFVDFSSKKFKKVLIYRDIAYAVVVVVPVHAHVTRVDRALCFT